MHGHTYEEAKHPACVSIVILHEMGKERAWLFLTKLRPKSSKCALGNAVISVSDLSEVLDYQIMPTRQSGLLGLSGAHSERSKDSRAHANAGNRRVKARKTAGLRMGR